MNEETKGDRRTKIERQRLISAVTELKLVAFQARKTWVALRDLSTDKHHQTFYGALVTQADAALDL